MLGADENSTEQNNSIHSYRTSMNVSSPLFGVETNAKSVESVNKPKVIVALDWENIFLSYKDDNQSQFGWDEICQLDDLLHQKYDVVDKSAYVDSSTCKSSRSILDSFRYNVVNVPSRYKESKDGNEILIKNAVDVEMALDVYDNVLTSQDIRGIVLLTGDGDFIPIIKRIKRNGIDVIVYSFKGHTSRMLDKFATEIYYLDEIYSQSNQFENDLIEKSIQEEINIDLMDLIGSEENNNILISKVLGYLYEKLGFKSLEDFGVNKASKLIKRYPIMMSNLKILKDRVFVLDEQHLTNFKQGGEALC